MPGESRKYGTTIAPSLYAPVHQHFFIARMDMAVDCKPNEAHNQVGPVHLLLVHDLSNYGIFNLLWLKAEPSACTSPVVYLVFLLPTAQNVVYLIRLIVSQVVEVNVKVENAGTHNVHNNAFYAEEKILKSELQAMRDCDPGSARHWIVREHLDNLVVSLLCLCYILLISMEMHRFIIIHGNP
jgi:hypothetical protein